MPDTFTPAFGRRMHHDPANRNYPVRGVLFAEAAPLVSRTWWRPGVWDQGQSSSCTAHACIGVVASSPFRHRSYEHLAYYDTFDDRMALYKKSQRYDPWPGERYEGTSTDAPFKVLRERGHISQWRWCFGLDDVLRTLSHHGPVAIGVDWHQGMVEWDRDFYLSPKGGTVGGHAVELIGLNVTKKTVTVVNSWGPGWARRGRGLLRFEDLGVLLEARGEAVTVVL